MSQRGVKGGYRLARDADSITVAEIIEAIEGPIAITECVEAAPGDCDKESWCPVRSNWQLINDAVQGALEGITLARMARPFEFISVDRPPSPPSRRDGVVREKAGTSARKERHA